MCFRKFHWRYIIGVYEDSDYGNKGFSEFKKLITGRPGSICFAEEIRVAIDEVTTQQDKFYLDTVKNMNMLNASGM